MTGSGRSLRYRLFAVAVAFAPLMGCSAGMSSFGSARLSVAEVANIASYGPQEALIEARAHFRNSDFGHAAAFYKRSVELAPGNAEGYFGLGASYDRLGRFDLSDRVYASLFNISGGTAQYYNNLGYSYLLRGNLAQASTNFRKAADLDPANPVIANNLELLSRATSA
jgi:Flp pilus assembly protein TadD